MAFLHFISAFAAATVPVFGAYIAESFTIRTPFLVMCIPTSLLSISMLIYILNTCKRKYHGIDNEVAIKNEEITFKELISKFDKSFILLFMSKYLCVLGAQFNNISLQLFLKEEYNLGIKECAIILTVFGAVCTISSLAATKLLLYIDHDFILRYFQLFMAISCILKFIMNKNLYFSFICFVFSVSFDCICGTMYFPVFDAFILSKIPKEYVGRTMAFMSCIGLIIGITSPIIVISGFYNINRKLPYIFGFMFSCLSSIVYKKSGIMNQNLDSST